MHQMRAASLSTYLEVAASVGLDGPRMLRQAGLSPEVLEDTERRLPASVVIGLIDRSAELSGCDSFGLLMAEARTFASLGPVSLLLEHLPNVREVVRETRAFQRHLNDVVEISLEEADDACTIRLDLAPGYWSVQTFDNVVGVAYRVLTSASGNRWTPDCVHLVRPAPQDQAVFRRMFAAPVEFDDTFNGLSSTLEAMLMPLPRANETMARHARRLLHLMPVKPRNEAMRDRVRRSITLLLPSGRATIDQVAEQLGMSARSLQRRLDEEGYQFAELLSGVRRELAAAYLANSGHPITTVAGLLGYASPSSFTRWFAGTFGSSPQVWRANNAERESRSPAPRR
jgi:AraC-like DNA-binding protein